MQCNWIKIEMSEEKKSRTQSIANERRRSRRGVAGANRKFEKEQFMQFFPFKSIHVYDFILHSMQTCLLYD